MKPSGVKTFLIQYGKPGHTRRFAIGRYGVLTLEEARQQARGLLADVGRGADPSTERKQQRTATTIADLCREYIDLAERGLILTRRGKRKKLSTLYTDRGRIERHIVPLLGKRPVNGLTPADVRAVIRDVTAGKTAADIKTGKRGRAIVKGGAGTAGRTVALLSAVFTYAVSVGYRPDNPVRGVERPAINRRRIHLERDQFILNRSRSRFSLCRMIFFGKAVSTLPDHALEADQYRALGAALDDAAGREPWQATEAARLLTLTGARLGEIVKLQRRECDVRNSCLRLGDSKTGESLRPLGKAALAVVQAALGHRLIKRIQILAAASFTRAR